MKIWYLKHPISLYKESQKEIRELAKENGLRIIDAKFGSNDEKVPELTLVDEPKAEPKKRKPRKPKAVIVEDITED